MMIPLRLAFLLLLFLPFPVQAAEKEKTLHQPNIEVWLPPEFLKSERKWPLVIFSHGFGGCARQSTFLTQYLADNGYIVAAPDHEDARWCRGNAEKEDFARTEKWPEVPFRFPEKWTDKTEMDRRGDIIFTLEDMLKNRQYADYIDQDKVAIIGHSLGGYTALALAGAWPSWKDSRFKAVVALSPFVQPFVLQKTLGKMDVPVMYQGGTRDAPITPVIKHSSGAYNQTKAPKYFLELEGANHFAWTQLDRGYQDTINATVLAFLNKYLEGKEALILAKGRKPAGVATFWTDEGASQQKTPPSLDE